MEPVALVRPHRSPSRRLPLGEPAPARARHDAASPSDPSRARIGMVSTYPPTVCGLATFSSALRRALEAAGHDVSMVQVDDGDLAHGAADRVSSVLLPGSDRSLAEAIAVLDRTDVAIVQHEFGIYGGQDGDDVLRLVRGLSVPVVAVLHTVPVAPTRHQAEILVELTARARWSVVMSDAARTRLVDGYPLTDPGSVVTIPHGAAVPDWSLLDGAGTGPQLLTWGLIGPGKGIEHVIDAVALLKADGISVPYTVAGVTHPKIRARDGEAYRDMLRGRAEDAGVGDLLTFDSAYRTPADMTAYVASARLVVLPYDSTEQVTSGVLVDSIAAGTPVIATRFPHAVELLDDGAGLVVPHRSPAGLAEAIRVAWTDPGRLRAMTRRARELAPDLSWSSVADAYGQLSQVAADRGAGTAA